jgi:hypothetical protein
MLPVLGRNMPAPLFTRPGGPETEGYLLVERRFGGAGVESGSLVTNMPGLYILDFSFRRGPERKHYRWFNSIQPDPLAGLPLKGEQCLCIICPRRYG